MYLYIKRVLDFSFSILAIVLLAPVFLGISVWIKLDSPGPIIFKQKRVGLEGVHFDILKFRTMRMDTPKEMPTHLLENPEIWITRVGRILRKTSLDELPQLFNILKGEMSFVGPRPALWNQYDLIQAREESGATHVPVGLTGWAQINGRDELEISEKARLDGYYAQNISFILDLKCVIKTCFCVFASSNIVEGKRQN